MAALMQDVASPMQKMVKTTDFGDLSGQPASNRRITLPFAGILESSHPRKLLHA
jgi:hypothetical protein